MYIFINTCIHVISIFSLLFFDQEDHEVNVAKLCNILVELHDLGFTDDIVMGQAKFQANVQRLYPDVAAGWFDLVPPNGTPGSWRSSNDSCPVIEMTISPLRQESAPPMSLEALLTGGSLVPGPRSAQALRDGSSSVPSEGGSASAVPGPLVPAESAVLPIFLRTWVW